MKQKMVFKVEMNCEKCRTAALKIAAETDGVNSMGFEGEKKEKLVVIGDGVDCVKLTRNLRNKVGHAELLTLAEMKN